MSRKIHTSLDLNGNQLLNALLQVLGADPGSPSEAQVGYNSTSHKAKLRDNTATRIFITDDVPLNSILAPTADLSLNTHKITGLLDPTAAQDAATKIYVDSLASGLDVKASVRASTTAALPTNTYNNGASGVGATLTATANGALAAQDGVTLVANDRLLVKNEATAANNGIYVVTQVGTGGTPYILTRATDADTAAELTPGAFTFVEEGTANADTGWTMTTNGAIVIGTTAINWAQFSSSATLTADETTLHKAGTVLSIISTYAGQSSIITVGTITTGVWNGTAIAVANGGTGSTTAAGARTNLGAVGKYAANVGDGAALSYVINHNLNSTDVIVQTSQAGSPFAVQDTEVERTDANNVTLRFAVAPATNSIRVVVIG